MTEWNANHELSPGGDTSQTIPSHAGLYTRGGYIPVPLAALVTEQDTTAYPFDLYNRDVTANHVRYVLFRSDNIPLRRQALERLIDNGVRFLYIKTSSHRSYTDYLQQNLPQAMADRQTSDAQKTEILYNTSLRLLEEIFAHPEDVGRIKQLLPIVDHISRRALKVPATFSLLAAMNNHDHYTTTHMVNVCGYASALAVAGGVGNPDDIKAVTLGALLHDLGKICISPDVLNKPGKLTQDEWAAVADHPARSLELAAGYMTMDESVCRVLVEHHERLDGQGYPQNLRGGEIHNYARICAVCDVFDSLTSHRMYRPIMTAQQALVEMELMVGDHLDPYWFDVLRQLVQGNLDARNWPPVEELEPCYADEPLDSPVSDANASDIPDPMAILTQAWNVSWAGNTPTSSTDAAKWPDEMTRSTSDTGKERRRHNRAHLVHADCAPVGVPMIAYEFNAEGTALCAAHVIHAVDVSLGGMGIISPRFLNAGTRVHLVPTGPVKVRRDLIATVVRSQPLGQECGYSGGLRFESNPTRQTIR